MCVFTYARERSRHISYWENGFAFCFWRLLRVLNKLTLSSSLSLTLSSSAVCPAISVYTCVLYSFGLHPNTIISFPFLMPLTKWIFLPYLTRRLRRRRRRCCWPTTLLVVFVRSVITDFSLLVTVMINTRFELIPLTRCLSLAVPVSLSLIEIHFQFQFHFQFQSQCNASHRAFQQLKYHV